MRIAQLTVVFSDAAGSYYSDEVLGGLFVHDVWDKNVRRPSGLWRWQPMHQPLVMPSDSRWVRAGGVAGRWTINGSFLDLYMFQSKVGFLRWWGGDSVGSGIPRYPLQTGALRVENPWEAFKNGPASIVDQLGGSTSKWMNIGYDVDYVDSPSTIPWHLHR